MGGSQVVEEEWVDVPANEKKEEQVEANNSNNVENNNEEAVVEQQVPIINQRIGDLSVLGIDQVEVVNRSFFSSEETLNEDNETINGVLKECDLEITCVIPTLVGGETFKTESIGAMITQNKTLSSVETQVKLSAGFFTELTPQPNNNNENNLQEQSVKLIVPLIRGPPMNKKEKPLLDKTNILTKDFTHHIVKIETNSPQGPWRIRVKTKQVDNIVEIVSVDQQMIDIPRVRESWDNVKMWLQNLLPRKQDVENQMSVIRNQLETYQKELEEQERVGMANLSEKTRENMEYLNTKANENLTKAKGFGYGIVEKAKEAWKGLEKEMNWVDGENNENNENNNDENNNENNDEQQKQEEESKNDEEKPKETEVVVEYIQPDYTKKE